MSGPTTTATKTTIKTAAMAITIATAAAAAEGSRCARQGNVLSRTFARSGVRRLLFLTGRGDGLSMPDQ